MPRNRFRGDIPIRRLFRRLPDEMKLELGQVFQRAGPMLARLMQASAPVGKTGHLIAGITWKFYASALRLRVGFLGVRTNRKLFYARILEFGRKSETVTVHRRRHGGAVNARIRKAKFDQAVSTYRLRVRGRAPQHFVYGPGTDLKRTMGRVLNGVWDRVLGRVSGGGNG